MKYFFIYVSIFALFFTACGSGPNPTGDISSPEHDYLGSEFPHEDESEPYFDPSTVTQELFDTTKNDVQKLIQQLNTIIRAKDYEAWTSFLSHDYFTTISSPEFLEQTSESARLKAMKIVLTNPKDYFLYVVVPSRANDRVDDIEFIAKTRVKAFTITPNGQRLRLYNLEQVGDSWKITN